MLRILTLLLCTVAFLQAADGPRKIAFARTDGLYVANLDGSGVKKIATGAWPRISPDGTRLAFNTDSPDANADRQIAVADVATGKVTVLPGIPSKNCFNPVWSPDGTKLLFMIHTDNDWHIGIVGADGSGFRYVKKAEAKGHSYYSMEWAPDGRSFYCQDLDAICRVGLDGAVHERWEAARLFPGGGLSSAARLAVSPNDGTLLVDVEMEEDVTRKDWEGPAPAVWSFNLATSRATRVTAKGVFAWEPCWTTAETFLCNIQPANAKEPSIYRVSADGKARQALIKSAREVSVSR